MTTGNVDGKLFRQALGAFTTGVTIVTTRTPEGVDAGLTANSFNSVSLSPPMVLWSLSKKSSSLASFSAAEHFAVHILASDQEALSGQFAKSGTDRFAHLTIERGAGSVPLLTGCAARFECRTTYRYEGGDHVISVGEVLAFEGFELSPLVFHGGKYGLLVKGDEDGQSQGSLSSDFLGLLLHRTHAQVMLPLREELAAQGLNEVNRHIISVLSLGDRRTGAEIIKLLEFTGHTAEPEHFQELVDLGLIHQDSDGLVSFTAEGRLFAIRHIAACKAAEADATEALSPHEARLLKSLLRRVVANTEKRVPDVWRRQKYWLDNNMWGSKPQ